MNSTSLSLVIPVYNEEEIIEQSLKILLDYLSQLSFLHHYEVIIGDDGSKDTTPTLLKRLTEENKNLKVVTSQKSQHIGIAKKMGLTVAEGDFVMTYAIDLPFGLEIIEQSLQAAQENPHCLILGSKGHQQSIINIPLRRRVQSKIFNLLLNGLYRLQVKDSQGTVLLPQTVLKTILPRLGGETDFFQAEILILGKGLGCRLWEIPIAYQPTRTGKKKQGNHFSGWKMGRELIQERGRLTHLDVIKGAFKL